MELGHNAKAASYPIEILFLHDADLTITSLVANPKIEKIVWPKFSDVKGTSGLSTYKASKWAKLNDIEVMGHLSELEALLSSAERGRTAPKLGAETRNAVSRMVTSIEPHAHTCARSCWCLRQQLYSFASI